MLARPAHCRYLLAAAGVALADGAGNGCIRQKKRASLRREGSNLANQWGRDNDFRSGARRGGAGTAIAVVIALLVGGAGGYGASLFLQDGQSVVSDAAQVETAELNKALENALRPIADAASDLGVPQRDADLLMVDVFAHAAGLLLLLHTGRIKMFNAAPEALMTVFAESKLREIERRVST